jgi:hypothetical protein
LIFIVFLILVQDVNAIKHELRNVARKLKDHRAPDEKK